MADLITFTEQQRKLIASTVGSALTSVELELLIYTAQSQGLDPLAKQIYAVKRGGRMALQTSIDGFRLMAARTGVYAGNDDAIFEEDDKGKPTRARVTVYRITEGQRCAYSASARWSEYNAGGNMWSKMPHTMLAKCAESLALRKAFPAELSGLYTTEEMDQAGPGETPEPIQTREEDTGPITGASIITVGARAGTRLDAAPERYLTWMATEADFDWPRGDEWQAAATLILDAKRIEAEAEAENAEAVETGSDPVKR